MFTSKPNQAVFMPFAPITGLSETELITLVTPKLGYVHCLCSLFTEKLRCSIYNFHNCEFDMLKNLAEIMSRIWGTSCSSIKSAQYPVSESANVSGDNIDIDMRATLISLRINNGNIGATMVFEVNKWPQEKHDHTTMLPVLLRSCGHCV